MLQRLSPSGLPRILQPASLPIQSALGLTGLAPVTLTLAPAGHDPGLYYTGLYRLRRGAGTGTLQMFTTLNWSSEGQLISSQNQFGIGGGGPDFLLPGLSPITLVDSDGTVAITLDITFTGTITPTGNLDVRSWAAPVL